MLYEVITVFGRGQQHEVFNVQYPGGLVSPFEKLAEQGKMKGLPPGHGCMQQACEHMAHRGDVFEKAMGVLVRQAGFGCILEQKIGSVNLFPYAR